MIVGVDGPKAIVLSDGAKDEICFILNKNK